MSTRTLRHYESVGLLTPSGRTEAGYRLYSDQDLHRLEYILALKFLGFSLPEIKRCLSTGTLELGEMLSRQRSMMEEKRLQIDRIVQALANVERVIAAKQSVEEAIAGVIEVIQMQQQSDWVKKYFTDEQIGKLDELSDASYSEEARQKLQARGPWTEADQAWVSAQWGHLAAESTRLASIGGDPAGEEGQALARLKTELIHAFTQGDPEIMDGLSKFWQQHDALPEDERPLMSAVPAAVMPGADDPGARFLDEAMAVYRNSQGQS